MAGSFESGSPKGDPLAEDFAQSLRREGWLESEEATLRPLAGGVSSDIYLAEDGERRFVVKRALEKLKVADDWHSDTSRNRFEQLYMRYVGKIAPDAVPRILFSSEELGCFGMEYLGDGYQNWKSLLLAGKGDAEQARQAMGLLARIHEASAGDAEAERVFDTTENFRQLRTDPYLRTTGERHAEWREVFEEEAARLEATRECLVHGDFSPKNILLGEGRLVLLDCEVAWYGDPAFDVAFLLNHFLLKALYHAPVDTGMRALFDAGVEAYFGERGGTGAPPYGERGGTGAPPYGERGGTGAPPYGERDGAGAPPYGGRELESGQAEELERRVARLLRMLLLARVDGKSPVEYLGEEKRDFVRRHVTERLGRAAEGLQELAGEWFAELDRG